MRSLEETSKDPLSFLNEIFYKKIVLIFFTYYYFYNYRKN